MQILEMQCIGRLQVPGPSSGIWQVGIVLGTFEDEEKQFRAVKFVSKAAELFYFIFFLGRRKTGYPAWDNSHSVGLARPTH